MFCGYCGKDLGENGVCDCEESRQAALADTGITDDSKAETAEEAESVPLIKPTNPIVSNSSNKKAIIAAVILVALALGIFLYIQFGKSSEKPTNAKGSQSGQTAKTAEEPSEPDLSNVDINAVEEPYMEIQGIVTKHNANYQIETEQELNIYIYNEDSGKNEIVENVNQLVIDDSMVSEDLTKLYEKEVLIKGYLKMRGSDVLIEAETVEKIRTEADEMAIHSYKIVITDCTWADAMAQCLNEGGYLARINTKEEYDYIVQSLNGYSNYHFYLGGTRNSNSNDYYWIDENSEQLGECLNTPNSWATGSWFRNEPSFVDTGRDAFGEITEDVMNLFCVNGIWYLNDSSGDLVGNYPDLLTGKVGYICEYE